MLSLKPRIVRISAALLVSSLLTLGAALPAFADNTIGGSSPVVGGVLAITNTTSADFSSVTINGTDQDPTAAATLDVKDDTGSGAGWKVTLAATQFTSGEGKTLANTALSITGVSAAANGSGTYTVPTSNVSYASAIVPQANTVTLFNSAVDTGMGHFTLTPAFKVHIPANAYAGTYSSTFTVTVVSGPA